MGALVTLLAVGLVQLALTLHVRNTLTSCASAGAHEAALADRTPEDGADRARSLASAALGGREVDAEARVADPGAGGMVTVVVTAPVPVLGLWGAASVQVSAHAIEEADGG